MKLTSTWGTRTKKNEEPPITAYNLALSTIVVEYFDRPADAAGPYVTDPERIADLARLIETLIDPVLHG